MLARRMSTDRIPASRGIASLTDIPEGECRHGPPELVIRCKHSVIPVPMLARRRDEIGEPVLRIVQMLLGGRYTVGELAEACEIPSHMASEHLRLMQRCGFLDMEKEGRCVYYTIAEPHLASIMACIEARFGSS